MNLREAKKELEEHGYIVEGSALKSKEEYKAIYEEAHKKIKKDLSFAPGLVVQPYEYYDWTSRTDMSKGHQFSIILDLSGKSLLGAKKKGYKINVGTAYVSGTGKIKYEIFEYTIQRSIKEGDKFGITVYLDNGFRAKYGACGSFEGTNANTITGSFEEVRDSIEGIIKVAKRLSNFIEETKDMYYELQR